MGGIPNTRAFAQAKRACARVCGSARSLMTKPSVARRPLSAARLRRASTGGRVGLACPSACIRLSAGRSMIASPISGPKVGRGRWHRDQLRRYAGTRLPARTRARRRRVAELAAPGGRRDREARTPLHRIRRLNTCKCGERRVPDRPEAGCGVGAGGTGPHWQEAGRGVAAAHGLHPCSGAGRGGLDTRRLPTSQPSLPQV